MRLRSGLCVCVAMVLMFRVEALSAQTAVPDWQTKAGGKMEFEVASLHEDKGPFTPPSFALSPDDAFLSNTDELTADFPLSVYIEFAYKLWLTSDQRHALYDSLPKWVTASRYKIQAKADHPATKDQMRLMMQSLLVDRFGLKLHFESKEAPVVAMTLAKPGVLGPRLHPASPDTKCDAPPRPSPNASPVPSPVKRDIQTMSIDDIPWTCNYMLVPRAGGMILGGARSTTPDLIAKFLGSFGNNLGFSRPVVDQTGLTGRYDFAIEFAQPPRPNAEPAANSEEAAPAGPDLLQAAREQLGFQFKPGKAVLSMPVIDHVELPSEN